MIHVPTQLSDQELLAEAKRLAEHERAATADLIATLAKLDTRRLYLGEGCSSLFSYCTHVSICPSTPRTGGSRPPAPRAGIRWFWTCSRLDS